MTVVHDKAFVLKISMLLAAGSVFFGCAENAENARAKQKIWNNEKEATELEQLASENLDTTALETSLKDKNRILTMSAAEAAQRFGFFEFNAKARIVIGGQRRKIEATEETKIIQGLHGSFTVQQKDGKGRPTRALVYNNGTMFIQNGTGEMRAQGVVKAQHIQVRQEAWEPLSVFSSYYGERFGLKKVASTEFLGREVMDYQVQLADGPELIESKTGDKSKKPISLEGQLLIDIETGVVLKSKLSGKLEVPDAKVATSTLAKSSKQKEPKSGTISVYLNSELKSIEGEEQRPKKFVDAIQRHPTDLSPLAFMKGDVRTSTVIGGKPKKKKKAPKAKKSNPPPSPKKKAKKAKPAKKTNE